MRPSTNTVAQTSGGSTKMPLTARKVSQAVHAVRLLPSTKPCVEARRRSRHTALSQIVGVVLVLAVARAAGVHRAIHCGVLGHVRAPSVERDGHHLIGGEVDGLAHLARRSIRPCAVLRDGAGDPQHVGVISDERPVVLRAGGHPGEKQPVPQASATRGGFPYLLQDREGILGLSAGLDLDRLVDADADALVLDPSRLRRGDRSSRPCEPCRAPVFAARPDLDAAERAVDFAVSAALLVMPGLFFDISLHRVGHLCTSHTSQARIGSLNQGLTHESCIQNNLLDRQFCWPRVPLLPGGPCLRSPEAHPSPAEPIVSPFGLTQVERAEFAQVRMPTGRGCGR